MISGPECVTEINSLLTDNKITFEPGITTLDSHSRGGLMENYDINLPKSVCVKKTAPLIMLVGAKNVEYFAKMIEAVSTVGVAAGSIFLLKDNYCVVLISYERPNPTGETL